MARFEAGVTGSLRDVAGIDQKSYMRKTIKGTK